jgi:hypothetical protein
VNELDDIDRASRLAKAHYACESMLNSAAALLANVIHQIEFRRHRDPAVIAMLQHAREVCGDAMAVPMAAEALESDSILRTRSSALRDEITATEAFMHDMRAASTLLF